MRACHFVLAALVVSGSARFAGAQTLSVGLTVRPAAVCGERGCLRIVSGRYHPATVADARPDAGDRAGCDAGFARFLVAVAGGSAVERRSLNRLRRCRALGLAPIIVRG